MDQAEGIHAFIFLIFDIVLVSLNVFLFTLPMYQTFISTYDNDDFLCFESTMSGSSNPEWIQQEMTTTSYYAFGNTFTTEVTHDEQSWFVSQNRNIQIWIV